MSEEPHHDPRANAASPEPEDVETGADTLEDAYARTVEQANEFRERYLRAVAELENYRRRAEKERQDTAKFAISSFARDALTVLDNLRRGLETVSAEDRKENPALESIAAGMELTEREMLATLERHGIEKVDPKGQPFDHNFHQAMMELEDASVPPGTVVQVLQAGYVIHGRLLRPAMVAVAKGGKKDAPPSSKVQAPIANEDLADDEEAGRDDGEGQAASDSAREGDAGDGERRT